MRELKGLLKIIFHPQHLPRLRIWGFMGLVMLALLATLGWRFFTTPVANSMSATVVRVPAKSLGSENPESIALQPLPNSTNPALTQIQLPRQNPQPTQQAPQIASAQPQVRQDAKPRQKVASIPLPSSAPVAFTEVPESNNVGSSVVQSLSASPTQSSSEQTKKDLLSAKTVDITTPNPESTPPAQPQVPNSDEIAEEGPSFTHPKEHEGLVSFSAPGLYLGKVVYEVAVDPKEKVIALTFDDGPWPRYTPRVLDILKENHIKATFFWIGMHLELYAKIGKRVVAEGHAIGNHTWHHRYHRMSQDEASAEIEHNAKLMERLAGVKTNLFRPPGGRLNNGLVDYAEMKRNTVLLWSVMPADTDLRQTSENIAERVLKNAQPGGIVLLHDGGGSREHTVKALPTIIAGLKKQGYHFVTIPELLKYPTIAPKIADDHRVVNHKAVS